MTNNKLELIVLIIFSFLIFGFMFYLVHGLQVHGQSEPNIIENFILSVVTN
jgi:hypothetical protein